MHTKAISMPGDSSHSRWVFIKMQTSRSLYTDYEYFFVLYLQRTAIVGSIMIPRDGVTVTDIESRSSDPHDPLIFPPPFYSALSQTLSHALSDLPSHWPHRDVQCIYPISNTLMETHSKSQPMTSAMKVIHFNHNGLTSHGLVCF